MAGNMRKNHDSAFKAKVALEATKGERTIGNDNPKLSICDNLILTTSERS